MTDLHCHILPGIDDGSKDLDMTLELLRAERKQGVDRIIFTPHFDPEKISVGEFLEKRNHALALTKEACRKDPELCKMHFKVGAEAYFRPSLKDIDCGLLAYTDSPYFLMEFSFTRSPAFVEETIYALHNQGIIPVIAHVERYPYLLEDMDRLVDLVESGCIIQTNCETLARDGDTARKMMQFMEWGLVHLVGTDAHHPEKRPVNIRAGLQVVDKRMGRDWTNYLIRNGNLIFAGQELDLPDPYRPYKRFGKWV